MAHPDGELLILTLLYDKPDTTSYMKAAAMLALYTSKGESLGTYISCMPLPSANKAEPTMALKPRGDINRSPKQGYQWPHSGPPTKSFKKNNLTSLHSFIFYENVQCKISILKFNILNYLNTKAYNSKVDFPL